MTDTDPIEPGEGDDQVQRTPRRGQKLPPPMAPPLERMATS